MLDSVILDLKPARPRERRGQEKDKVVLTKPYEGYTSLFKDQVKRVK